MNLKIEARHVSKIRIGDSFIADFLDLDNGKTSYMKIEIKAILPIPLRCGQGRGRGCNKLLKEEEAVSYSGTLFCKTCDADLRKAKAQLQSKVHVQANKVFGRMKAK